MGERTMDSLGLRSLQWVKVEMHRHFMEFFFLLERVNGYSAIDRLAFGLHTGRIALYLAFCLLLPFCFALVLFVVSCELSESTKYCQVDS